MRTRKYTRTDNQSRSREGALRLRRPDRKPTNPVLLYQKEQSRLCPSCRPLRRCRRGLRHSSTKMAECDLPRGRAAVTLDPAPVTVQTVPFGHGQGHRADPGPAQARRKAVLDLGPPPIPTGGPLPLWTSRPCGSPSPTLPALTHRHLDRLRGAQAGRHRPDTRRHPYLSRDLLVLKSALRPYSTARRRWGLDLSGQGLL